MKTKKAGECELLDDCEISLGKSVTEAAKSLKKNKARHVYVVKNKVPMGVVSSIDIVNDVIAEGKSSNKTKVEEIMRYPIHAIDFEDSIVDAYFKLAKFNMVVIPVLKNKRIVGLLTSHEIMKHFVKQGSKK